MQSTWNPTATDACALTTDRGPFENDASFIARHESALDAVLSGAVTDEGERDEVLEEHVSDFESKLGAEGDRFTKGVDLTQGDE